MFHPDQFGGGIKLINVFLPCSVKHQLGKNCMFMYDGGGQVKKPYP